MSEGPIPESAEHWFARMNSGARTSEPDERAFRAWLAESPANVAAFRECQQAWLELGLAAASPDVLAMRADALRSPLAVRRRFVLGVGGAGIAAGALGAIAAWRFADARSLATAQGERLTRTMADGTRMTLAPMSRVEIALGGARRRVRLTRGQAYFQVAHDPARPFEVSAGEVVVTAIGTRFQTALGENGVEVVLEEGRVSVARADAATAAIMLSPGEKYVAMTVAKEGAIEASLPEVADVEAETAWRDGRLVFKNEPLSEVTSVFNRYSRDKIVIADPDAARVRISGSFDYDAGGDFAQALQSGFGLVAKRRDDGSWVVSSATAP